MPKWMMVLTLVSVIAANALCVEQAGMGIPEGSGKIENRQSDTTSRNRQLPVVPVQQTTTASDQIDGIIEEGNLARFKEWVDDNLVNIDAPVRFKNDEKMMFPPLTICLIRDYTEGMKYLLEKGADPNALFWYNRMQSDSLSILFVIGEGSYGYADVLLSSGYVLDKKPFGFVVDGQTVELSLVERFLMHVGESESSVKLLSMLLEKGLNCSKRLYYGDRWINMEQLAQNRKKTRFSTMIKEYSSTAGKDPLLSASRSLAKYYGDYRDNLGRLANPYAFEAGSGYFFKNVSPNSGVADGYVICYSEDTSLFMNQGRRKPFLVRFDDENLRRAFVPTTVNRITYGFDVILVPVPNNASPFPCFKLVAMKKSELVTR